VAIARDLRRVFSVRALSTALPATISVNEILAARIQRHAARGERCHVRKMKGGRMNSKARDTRLIDRCAYALLRPPPARPATRRSALLAPVLIGLVACGFHAGNPAFGIAAAMSLMLVRRASRHADRSHLSPVVDSRC